MGGCMDQWVGSGQMTNLIKFETYQYNLILFEDTYGWMGGSMGRSMGGLMSNH